MGRALENRLSDLYISHFGELTDGWPAAVNDARRESLEAVMLQGLPGSGAEAYRHFDVRKLIDGAQRLAALPPVATAGSLFMLENACHTVVENGYCRDGELTTLAGGAVYGSLKSAAQRMPETVSRYIGTAVERCGADSVAAICAVFSGDGAFVYVPRGCNTVKPFHIDIRYTADSRGELCFPRVLVVVEDGASAEVVITQYDSGENGIIAGHLREVIVQENARLDIAEVSSMGSESILVSGNYTTQGTSSKIGVTALWSEGGATRVNAVTSLDGRDCDSTLYGLMTGNGCQLCDVNMKVAHQVPDCRSYEVVKGVVSDNATASFTGMVYVAPDAQRTSALQQSRNLQLSDTSRIFTEPQLEIYADDVKCSHGATVGQLNEEEVYYMRQRGIAEQDARRLQLQGFVNDVISHCTIEEACRHMSRIAEERISGL